MKGASFLSLPFAPNGHHLSLFLYFPSLKALPSNLSSREGERRVEILPTPFNTTQIPSYLSPPFTSTLPPNFWVIKMKESYERFIELFNPLSDVKILYCIFQLYEWGVREFTYKDLSRFEQITNSSILHAIHRLERKGVVRQKYILPLRNGGRVKVFELNERNEVVQKLFELFRVVVNGKWR